MQSSIGVEGDREAILMRGSDRRSLWSLLTVLVAIVVVAQCSSSASTRADKAADTSTTVPEPVAAATAIPPGTVLRVGDQSNYLKTHLALAGQDHDLAYKVTYAEFDGGPPMLLAFKGRALDTGFVGTSPLLFAQAQGQDLRAVAAWATPRSAYSLITAPGADGIKGWGDLKGKRVAYQRGSADEGVLIQALDTVGMQIDDIKTVDVPPSQLSAALQGGSADAGIAYGPLSDGFLSANPTAHKVAPATAITDRTATLIATTSALTDKGKSAALADYITRLVRSFTYLRAHPDRLVDGLYVKEFGLPRPAADALLTTAGVDKFVSLPGAVLKQQQRLADLYFENGTIPKKLDVADEFDTRFNELVENAQSG
jgi:sulfonate transport system substrate-binding protein